MIEALKYREFIEEIYLNPIRTAIVVDDDYPTLDELLTPGTPAKAKFHKMQLKKIIDVCRSQKPTPWLVDVHNGKTPSTNGEKQTANFLDHSDLLILDYHLEGDSGSEKSIEILRSLASNGHFNLVVVYTKDRMGGGAGILQTIREIGLSLAHTPATFLLSNEDEDSVTDKIESWGNTELNIFDDLKKCFDDLTFLKIIGFGQVDSTEIRNFPELIELRKLISNKPNKVALSCAEIIQFFTHLRARELKPKMASESFGRVTVGESNDTNWIRADSIFVTVISKEHQPEEIRGLLLDALVKWNPPPHRLIISKMRNELDQQGAVAEVMALNNRHLQAGWLAEVLETNEALRKTNVRLSLQRHWESLGGNINGPVFDFADKLSNFLALQGGDSVVKFFDDRGAVGEQEKVYLELNCHACSKKIEGHHLTTGHILRVDTEYWLCLTPACDLQPGQSNGWSKKLVDWIPFKAVQIFETKAEIALKECQRGTFLFLCIGGRVLPFSFNENGGGANETQAAKWEQLFAGNQGCFVECNKLDVAMIRKNVKLEFRESEAVVVAQLRYEYALNLTNRLGAHLSRVGLDFKSYPTKAAKK